MVPSTRNHDNGSYWLLFGYLSILGGQSTFGYGLFLAGGWTLLSRGQALLGGPTLPCTLEMAQRLQMVMNIADSEDACCSHHNRNGGWNLYVAGLVRKN